MKATAWTIIVILITVVAVGLYGWLVLGWFNPAENSPEKKVTAEITDQEQITINDRISENDARLLGEIEDTMMALDFYAQDQVSFPQSLTELVPEVAYEISSDREVLVAVILSDLEKELMSNDDGTDNSRYELTVEIYE
jgi:flagellar basal body-associated protein FliL